MEPTPPSSDLPLRVSAGERLFALDALRGVAALAVVLFHVQGALGRAPQPWMPEWLAWFARQGHFGVNIFFVLSGFVIAYSVRRGTWTPGYLGRFALRRSIRLDPPYWSAIALEIALIFLGIWLVPGLDTPLPTVPQVLAHLAYLQDILGYPHLVYSFWTLCYEFQFYLAFVGLLVAGQSLKPLLSALAMRLLGYVVFGGLFAWSILVHQGVLPNVHRGVALDRWHEFFIGAVAWWVVGGVVRFPVLILCWVATAMITERADTFVGTTIVVAVSIFCIVSATRPGFNRALESPVLRWLGALSYSLYLYHASVGWRVVSLAQHEFGMQLPALMGWITWLGAIGGAFVTAIIGLRLIEAPSIRLSRRVKLPVRTASPQSVPSGATTAG